MRWGLAGRLNTFSPFVIAMYYIVIETWCFAYAVQYLGGLLQHVGLGFSLFSDVNPCLKFDSTSGYEGFFGRFIGIGQDGSLFGVEARDSLDDPRLRRDEFHPHLQGRFEGNREILQGRRAFKRRRDRDE